jgi:large subunit ribosomal protein L15
MIDLVKVSKKTKRLGRGRSSGKGKTSGRGMNGQKSRTGSGTTFFEGGQTKITSRLPKAKGFKSRSKVNLVVLTTQKLSEFYKEGEVVDLKSLLAKKIIKEKEVKDISIKIIKKGDSKIKFTFAEDIKLSKSLKK